MIIQDNFTNIDPGESMMDVVEEDHCQLLQIESTFKLW